MSFELNDEKALDVMIWWVEASNGSIDFREKEAVEDVLKDMNYSMETYYEESLMHIGGLSTDHLKDLVDRAIQYGEEHYSEHQKEKTIALLYAVAESNNKVTDDQREKIENIRKRFGVEPLEAWKKDE